MIPLRDTIRSRTFPIMTISLILINLLIYVYEISLGTALPKFLQQYGVVPANYFVQGHLKPVLVLFNILPLISAMFLHGGWVHVIGNMWFLWIFGDNVEDRIGHTRFLFFYILCGILATAGHIFINPASQLPLVGASGAIAGVMGAYFILFPRSRILTAVFLLIIFTVVEIRAVYFLAIWILFQLLSGAAEIGTASQTGGVAWWAHLGGFISGAVLVFLFRKSGPRKAKIPIP